MPKGAVVDLRTTNGKVQLTGLTSEVHARTVNGGVTGRGLAVQVLEASTVNGGVDVEIAEPLGGDARVSLECVNGGVQLALPGDSKRAILARVTNGGITRAISRSSRPEKQTRRRVEGTLNGGGASSPSRRPTAAFGLDPSVRSVEIHELTVYS